MRDALGHSGTKAECVVRFDALAQPAQSRRLSSAINWLDASGSDHSLYLNLSWTNELLLKDIGNARRRCEPISVTERLNFIPHFRV